MKPENQKRMIGAGAACMVAAASDFALNHNTTQLDAVLGLLGGILVVQALILGRKPRA